MNYLLQEGKPSGGLNAEMKEPDEMFGQQSSGLKEGPDIYSQNENQSSDLHFVGASIERNRRSHKLPGAAIIPHQHFH